jgi:hypothetical protein
MGQIANVKWRHDFYKKLKIQKFKVQKQDGKRGVIANTEMGENEVMEGEK